MSDFHLRLAAAALRDGGVIAYPTEAVYGLGCYPDDGGGVARILAMKRRPVTKGLILLGADVDQIAEYVDYPDDDTRRKVHAMWPGPITWVLPARPRTPSWITGGGKTVAVRVGAHPLTQALCSKVGVIVSTSANPAGKPPAVSAARVRSYFGAQVDYVLPGATGGHTSPTEIRTWVDGSILRSAE